MAGTGAVAGRQERWMCVVGAVPNGRAEIAL
jgi:hypothetical protein